MGMEQTIEELLAQKTPVLYKAAHVSIRQLAEKLRTAMKDASKGGNETKAVQYAFGLPFIKSVKLWVQAVSKSPALKPLVQPLLIVLLSAIRAKEMHLIFLPYVSILLSLVNDLSLSCETFVPIVSSCLSALSLCSNKLASKSLTAEGREPNISDVVRVSDRQLKDKRVVRGLTLMITKELTRHMAFLARTCAFPEVAWPVVQALRKLAKSNPVIKPELSSLIESIDESVVEIKEKRIGNMVNLFQFEFEETSMGKEFLRVNTLVKKTWTKEEEEEDEDEEDESDDEENEDKPKLTKEERTKRSIKRQRQNEKKRALKLENSEENLINKTIRVINKIDLESELVPFNLSDDEE